MISAFKNIFAIPDLRGRVLFTLGMLAVYRIGGHIPTPGINTPALLAMMERQSDSMLGYVDLFSGGSFSNMTIFALNIFPYITASIILQLLTVLWPYMEKMSKEGEAGRRKITQYTRYGTVVLSVIQAFGIALWLEGASTGTGGAAIVANPGWGFRLMTVLTLTTGTAFIMWLGEQISDRGIGNGISLIIYAGIVVSLPSAVVATLQDLSTGQISPIAILLLLVVMVAVIGAIVFVERAQRRIPIQYARRVVGRKIYGGTQTYLPLRVNTGGVIPVIFASSMLAIPPTIGGIGRLQDVTWAQNLLRYLDYGTPFYDILFFAAIVFFCFFYVSIIFNPMDQADNMKKYGGFIPGIRPGKKTAEYIDRILTRLTFGGAIYLALVALLPIVLTQGFKAELLPWIGPTLDSLLPPFITQGMRLKFLFGGTALLIVVGVAMDTVQQIESQLIMRHYEGFLKSTRIKGRRG